MPWKLVTAPTDEPVYLEAVRDHCRITTHAEDSLLLSYMQVARDHLEYVTRRQFLTATLLYTLDDFPACREILLPRPPLQSITSVKYYDTTNVLQTLATSVYTSDTMNEPGRVILKPDQVWPAVYDLPNAVEIRYVAGWNDPLAVPHGIRQAILLLTSHLYENREGSAEKALLEIPLGICALAGMHRIEELY